VRTTGARRIATDHAFRERAPVSVGGLRLLQGYRYRLVRRYPTDAEKTSPGVARGDLTAVGDWTGYARTNQVKAKITTNAAVMRAGDRPDSNPSKRRNPTR